MKRVILVVGAAALLLVVGTALGILAARSVYIGFTIGPQPGWIRLPSQLSVTAEATEALDIVLDGQIAAEVPLRRTLELPLRGRYSTEVELATTTRLEFTIDYDGVIDVDTVAEITAETSLNFQNVKQYRDIQLRATVPLQIALPVQLSAPVSQEVDIAYSGPLEVEIDQRVSVALDTVIDTEFSVHERVSTPVLSRFPLQMAFPSGETGIVVEHAALRIALSSLRLSLTDDPSQPQREVRPPPTAAPEAPR